MTIQLKKDLRTIVEVLAYLVISFSVVGIYSEYPWIWGMAVALGIAAAIYRGYFMRYRADTILFPTQNDDSSKMKYVAFGIMVLFFSLVGRFAFSIDIYRFIIGMTIGVVVIFFGLFESPKGWLTVSNNMLTVIGIIDTIDIRQLKEIVLYSDKIILTNIYDEQKNSMLLKLSPPTAQSVRKFLENKLGQNKVLVIDNVT